MELKSEKAKKRGKSLAKIRTIREALSGVTGEGSTLEKTPNYLLKGFWAEEQALAKMHQGGPILQSGKYELLAGEMVMDNEAAEIIRSSVSIFGQILNQQAMDRSGMGGSGGANSATIIDNSSQPIVTNNTIINSPKPQGQMLPGAGRDHAVSHFRHAA